MSRDIRSLLREAAPVPDLTPNLDAIRHGGRMMRTRRRITTVFAVGTMAILTVLAVPRLDLRPSEADGIPPANPVEQQPPEYDLDPTGPGTVLARGKHDGTRWELVALETESGRYCAEFRLGEGEAFGGFSTCGDYVPEFEHLKAIRGYFDERQAVAPVIGAVSHEVAAVAIQLSDGRVVEAEILSAPEASSADFYIAFVEAGLSGTATALNGAGEVIEEDPVDVCRPAASVASCGHRAPDDFES